MTKRKRKARMIVEVPINVLRDTDAHSFLEQALRQAHPDYNWSNRIKAYTAVTTALRNRPHAAVQLRRAADKLIAIAQELELP